MNRYIEIIIWFSALTFILLFLVTFNPALNEWGFTFNLLILVGLAAARVLGETLIEKYRDERMVPLMNLSARNGFVFLMIVVPWVGIILTLSENLSPQQLIGTIMELWILTLLVYFGSLFYYYRK
ncbi:MAG: hypothetical protein RTU92_14420 [Candidatus Thorarchaeota archaeon]